jgi:TolB-like protein/DNA-binding SARP family transcriptional activator/Tfp pilus assembly protein PilF
LFRLKLFGGASLEGPGAPLTGRAVQRRRLALLALLAVARERGVTRDKLVAYLWPDSSTERSRHLLSDSVYRINQALGGDAIVATGDALRLNPERLASDVWEFADALENGELERAVDVHAAPFLDGFFLTNADEFERWAETERGRQARERAHALESLAEAGSERGDAVAAVRWWRTLASDDPYSSRIALRLMSALEAAGDPAAAVQHARIHSVLVRDQLGVEPDPEIDRFADRLRTADPGTRAGGAPGGGIERPTTEPEIDGAARTEPQVKTGSAGDRAPRDEDPGALTTPAGDPSVAAEAGALAAGPSSRRVGSKPFLASRRTAATILAGGVLGVIAVIVAIAAIRGGRGAPPAASEPAAIAVLPFADVSPDRDQEYFADGITEELMVRLSKLEGLAVVGRTSAFAFKGRAVDVREIGRQLGVSAVLEGSVRRADDRLRIVAQLVDATNGYELWSETYEREASDVFAVQDEIARAIVTRLTGRLARSQPVPTDASQSEDPEAYNLYLQGRFEWHKRTEQGLRASAEYFRQATERAPAYARAWVGLGDAHAVLGFYDYLSPADAFPAAAAAARRALELDPTLAEAHATLAYVALYHDWDWARAEAEFLRTIALYPGYSTGHQWYANLLTAMGRFEEAIREMRIAQELDPLSLIANAALGWVLYYAGDYERAADQFGRTLDMNPRFELAHLFRGAALQELGRTDEALQDFVRAVELSGGSTISRAALARGRVLAGDRRGAHELLNELETGDAYTPSYEIAKIHEALDDHDAALSWLERAFEQRSHSMAFLAVDPQLRDLHTEPRFHRLISDVGLDGIPLTPAR